MSEERFTQSISLEKSELLEMDDDMLDRVGKMFALGFKRRRNQILCDRDGHTESDMLQVLGVCERCGVVVDEAQHAVLRE